VPEPTAEEKAAAEAAEAKRIADEAEAKRLEDERKAKEVKFTQADLDRIAGEARANGRSTAETDLLKTLGVTDLDAAKALLAEAKAAEDAKLSEVERLTKERDEAKQEADRTLQTATQLLALTKLEGALRDSGINPERIPAAMKLVDTTGLKVDGLEVAGIPEAIEAVKASTPEWFGKVTPRPSSPDATGGAVGDVDYRKASRDELAEAARKYNVKL
jgi:hypothetical protein